jgi:hypothetical protein
MKTVFLVFLLASSIGCCGTLSRETAYHDGVKQYTVESGMLTEYEAYIEADAKLKPETKVIRKNTSKGLRALLAQEEKALKKD